MRDSKTVLGWLCNCESGGEGEWCSNSAMTLPVVPPQRPHLQEAEEVLEGEVGQPHWTGSPAVPL